MRVYIPHLAHEYRVETDTKRLHQDMKLPNRCVGAIIIRAASVWPYKIVMGLLQRLIENDELNVRPHTPVTSIDDGAKDEVATVRTSRGEI